MTSQPASTLRARYGEQAASDLEENRRLQRELTERIAVLKQEEELLADILRLAGGSGDTPVLPGQAEDEPDAPKTGDEPREAKTKGGLRAAKAKAKGEGARRVPKARDRRRAAGTKEGAGARKAKSARPAPGSQPLLGDLLTDLLGGHTEPRLAKELREELMEKHSDRTPTPQVVRNTLENLVAKGQVQRHKQGRSVMYTLTTAEKAPEEQPEPQAQNG
ncbi:BlaI/MecI/CopY family transcriptional regulator [Streptomyces sp. NPDC004830]